MRLRLTALYSIFVISGFCGLIYESVWARYLRIFLGHAAYGQSVVLVVFIGGLAFGAGLIGRRAERIGHPLVIYATAQLAIGICAILFHGLFTGALAWAYDKLLPATCSAQGVCASAVVLAAALILPQSILLGTTFPLMVSGVLRDYREGPGRKIARLYFLNSIGATVGVLASGFVLVPAVGLPGTVMIAGLLNIAIALVTYLLAGRGRTQSAESPVRADEVHPGAVPATQSHRTSLVPAAQNDPYALSNQTWLLWVAMFTGLSSFVCETVWIRMLSLVLGSSVHAFELMLSAFILGIALGGLWIRRRIDRLADPARFLAQLQVAMGLLALLSLPYWSWSFDAMAWWFNALARDGSGYVLFNVGSAALAMGMMVPATVAAGMTFPLLTFVLFQGRLGERSIGAVYSANALGSIAGVIAGIHLGLGLLGVRGTLISAAGIDILLGIWIFAASGWPERLGRLLSATTLWVTAGPVGLLVAITAFTIDPLKAASGIYRLGRFLEPGAVVRYHRDGKSATVDVVQHPSGVVSIRTNGKPDSSIQMQGTGPPTLDEYTSILMGSLPFMYRSYVARAAVIGFGSGMTTTTLLDAPAIQRVDTIEIEPAMVQGAKAFLPRVEGAFADPRSRIIFDDAKAYFARSRDTYDVIVSQPSNPWVSRGASLFTAEFYERIRRKLKPDGLFIQSLQCYEFDLPLLADIVAALDTSFTDYALYTTSGELVLVATPTGRLGLPGTQPLLTEPLASDLRALGINRIADLAALWAGSRATVDAYLQSVTLARNSDYFPVVELDAPLRRFTGARVTEFESLALAAVPVLRMLDQRAPAASEGVSRPASPEVNVPVAFYHAEQALRFLDSVGERDARPTPPGYPGQIDSFRAALIDCTSPTRTSDAWDDVVFVAGMVNPALPPERLDAFWNKIGQSRCVKDLPDYYRTWIALFRDVGNRDSVGMVRHAETLLKLPGTTTQLEYLLLAETTGLLSQGRNAEARRWLVGDVPSSTKDLPWYQLATMLANGT